MRHIACLVLLGTTGLLFGCGARTLSFGPKAALGTPPVPGAADISPAPAFVQPLTETPALPLQSAGALNTD
jgi:hypothetical protein